MGDAEAEAALLALGPQIEWKQYIPRSKWSIVIETAFLHNETVVYQATPFFRRWLLPWQSPFYYLASIRYQVDAEGKMILSPANEYYTRKFKTCIAAKAACERHYATGKWE